MTCNGLVCDSVFKVQMLCATIKSIHKLQINMKNLAYRYMKRHASAHARYHTHMYDISWNNCKVLE